MSFEAIKTNNNIDRIYISNKKVNAEEIFYKKQYTIRKSIRCLDNIEESQ